MYGLVVSAGLKTGAGCLLCVSVSPAAAAASRSSPDDDDLVAGVNVGSGGRCNGSGNVPSGRIGGGASMGVRGE